MKTGKKEFLFYTDWDDRVTGSASALAGRLVSFATEFGLSGNVWQQWLTYVLMMHENAFTRACERRDILPDSTLMQLAKLDLGTFMELFRADDSDFDDDEKVLLNQQLISLLDCNKPVETKSSTKEKNDNNDSAEEN